MSSPELCTTPLTVDAHRLLVHRLVDFGNTPSESHQATLFRLMEGYTGLASGRTAGRFVFPLGTGLGKSLSYLCWAATMTRLGLGYSLAVCASKVEALCGVKRDLIGLGVPEDAIGLFHSYGYDQAQAEAHLKGGAPLPPGYASEPATQGHDQKRILLMTHQRVRGSRQTPAYLTYQGNPRSLFIWDESLISSETSWLPLIRLRSAVSSLAPLTGSDCPFYLPACKVYGWCMTNLGTVLREQSKQEEGAMASPLELTPPDRETREALNRVRAGMGREAKPQLDLIEEFMDITWGGVRVAGTYQGQCLVSFERVIPEGLSPLVVLDASYPIRDLEQMDPTLEVVPTRVAFDYSPIRINLMKHSSGRDCVSTLFRKPALENRLISLELAEVIKALPPEEGIIVFTFLDKEGVYYVSKLKGDFQALGIDTGATVQVNGHQKPRLNFITWGDETSHSRYSYCSYILFAGVLHRSHLDIAANIIGQRGDLATPVSKQEARETVQSEVAHSVYQALNRGACRIVNGTSCQPLEAWLFHLDESLRERLERVMPGMTWGTWTPKYMQPGGVLESVAQAIGDYLSETTEDLISSAKLKKDAGLTTFPSTTYKKARDMFLKGSCVWEMNQRSYIRKESPVYYTTVVFPDVKESKDTLPRRTSPSRDSVHSFASNF